MDKVSKHNTFQPIHFHKDEILSRIEALIKNEDYPAALKILHQILDETDGMDPILFDVYKHMGNIYLKCGDIEAAEEKYNQAHSINCEDENLTVNYGVLAIQRGEYSAARDRFSQAIQKNTSNDLAWVGLALVHRAHADHDLAKACLLRALDENNYNKMAIVNLHQWSEQDGTDVNSHLLQSYLEKFPSDSEVNTIAVGQFQ